VGERGERRNLLTAMVMPGIFRLSGSLRTQPSGTTSGNRVYNNIQCLTGDTTFWLGSSVAGDRTFWWGDTIGRVTLFFGGAERGSRRSASLVGCNNLVIS